MRMRTMLTAEASTIAPKIEIHRVVALLVFGIHLRCRRLGHDADSLIKYDCSKNCEVKITGERS
jgi:hypothetical protein